MHGGKLHAACEQLELAKCIQIQSVSSHGLGLCPALRSIYINDQLFRVLLRLLGETCPMLAAISISNDAYEDGKSSSVWRGEGGPSAVHTGISDPDTDVWKVVAVLDLYRGILPGSKALQ